MDAPAIPKFSQWLGRTVCSLAILAALAVMVLYTFQGVLLWHPMPYPPGRVEAFPRPLATLGFRTAQGKQTAFYAPPRDGRPMPSALWVLFAGNGSLALDWQGLADADADPGHAFLFIDYPGYGRCEGNPSPAAIAENVTGAMDALGRHLGQPDGTSLEQTLATHGQLAVAGHSMGTGAALAFAARCPAISRIVLVAPFTSLRAMAQRTIGWPLCWLVRGNFDNQARLDELAARSAPPRVRILHGERDSLIPPAMGRDLAAAHPGFVRFELVRGADHGDVVEIALTRLLTVLDER